MPLILLMKQERRKLHAEGPGGEWGACRRGLGGGGAEGPTPLGTPAAGHPLKPHKVFPLIFLYPTPLGPTDGQPLEPHLATSHIHWMPTSLAPPDSPASHLTWHTSHNPLDLHLTWHPPDSPAADLIQRPDHLRAHPHWSCP